MLITPAFAQTAAPPASGFDFSLFVPLIAMFAIMYFLVLRPQQQRLKAHREMVANVRRGDVIVTSGGMIGKVTRVVDENEVQVEIAENVRVRLLRSTIAEVRSKGEPVKEAPAA